MDFMGLPVFAALKQKMQWHQARQGVLAENIANAATPGYMAKEVQPTGQGGLKLAGANATSGFAAMVTNPKHITAAIAPPSGLSGSKTSSAFEITPDGNSVVLEEQMMKIAGNQMDYQAATSLYTSNLGLLRTAIGGSGR